MKLEFRIYLKDKHATLLQTMYSNDKHMENEYEKLQNAHTWLKNNHATLLQTMYSNDKKMEEEYQKLQKAHTELKDKHATLLQTMDSNDKNEPKKVARKRWNAGSSNTWKPTLRHNDVYCFVGK